MTARRLTSKGIELIKEVPMQEFVIDESEEDKTTFIIGKYNVIFSDYNEDELVASFSISHEAFELAIKAWKRL